MLGEVVGGFVLTAVPDHVRPGARQDADEVRLVVAAAAGALVDTFGPRIGASAVAGEVADGVAKWPGGSDEALGLTNVGSCRVMTEVRADWQVVASALGRPERRFCSGRSQGRDIGGCRNGVGSRA